MGLQTCPIYLITVNTFTALLTIHLVIHLGKKGQDLFFSKKEGGPMTFVPHQHIICRAQIQLQDLGILPRKQAVYSQRDCWTRISLCVAITLRDFGSERGCVVSTTTSGL